MPKPKIPKLQHFPQLVQPQLEEHADLDLPPLKDDLNKFLNDNGISFLEKDLRKNNINCKKLFFTLRKDEKTIKNILDGKNETQRVLANKIIFMGKTHQKEISENTRYSSSLMRTNELPDKELVGHFSVNCGMLLKKDGVIVTKQPVFEFYDAQIRYDNIKPAEISSFYFSKRSSMERREKLVVKGGNSFGMNAKISAAGMTGPVLSAFSISASIHSTIASEYLGSSTTEKTSSSLYGLQVDSYPKGVLRVERNKIHLNEDIISKLEDIKIMKDTTKRRISLWRFMEIYGSHVCPEVILGGVYIDATTSAFTGHYTLQEKERLVSKAYNASIGVDVTIGASVGGGLGKDIIDGKGQQKKIADKSEKVTISFNRTIHGGDTQAPKPLWKESLSCSSKYAVIDRSFDKIIGIWELLPKELKCLAKEFKMTYLNKVFNNNKPWIGTYNKIIDKQRSDYYTENKAAIIKEILKVAEEKNSAEKFSSGKSLPEKNKKLSSNMKPFVENKLYSQLVQAAWSINVAIKNLSNAAIKQFNEQEAARWHKEKVVFFEIKAQISTNRRSDNMMKFIVADHWHRYDSRFLRRNWPRDAHAFLLKHTWGAIVHSSDGFSYSNNRNRNPLGWHAAKFHIHWTASRKALLVAGFTKEEITKQEPMFRYETIPDVELNCL